MIFRLRSPFINCLHSVLPVLTVLLVLMGCGGGGGGGDKNTKKPGSGLPVTLSGIAQFENRIYNQNGFSGTNQKPVRHAVIEVVRSSDGEVLEIGATGPDGKFEITFTNKGEAGVYVRVKAQASNNTVVVRNNGSLALYALSSPTMDDAEEDHFEVNLFAGMTTIGGVFNILDVLSEGAEFIQGLTGGTPPPMVTALWSSGSCDGTYFNPLTNTIGILGGCGGDTDEYDDSVLLHEYGHFISKNYSKDHSPGGQHFLADSHQDLRLAWSEGWGNFFAGVVRGDPLYVDTLGNVAGIAFELEGVTSPMVENLSSLAVYTASELSVAAVLWDIYDSTPSEVLNQATGVDSVSAGMAPIWDVFTGYLCPTCPLNAVSFEVFWDGWFSRGHGLQGEMEGVTTDRLMALTVDSYEPDNTNPSSGSVIAVDGGPNPARTLYPAGDIDHFLFFVSEIVPHRVETLSLTNGADTFIEVLGSDGATVFGSNDNSNGASYTTLCGVNPLTQLSSCPPNDPTTLASRVTFTPTTLGTHFIRVKPSPNAPPSAGRYGGYQIQVTLP